MTKFIITTLLITLSTISFAENDKPQSFHSFLRLFFTDAQFQLEHILFPIELNVIDPDPASGKFTKVVKFQKKPQWQVSLHKHFECESVCIDRVVYDSFKQIESNSDERVYSLQDTNNGISVSWLFKRSGNSWRLVRYQNDIL